jgi:hypothetical protein
VCENAKVVRLMDLASCRVHLQALGWRLMELAHCHVPYDEFCVARLGVDGCVAQCHVQD